MIRVFLADDHTIFRQGLKGLLDEDPSVTVVGEAEDGRLTIKRVRQTCPDVVLMDIGMPGLNGIEATRALRREFPNIRILGLSMHVDERFVGAMLRAGAAGYLCKKCDADEVLTAIRAVVTDQAYLSPAIAPDLMASYVRHVPADPSAAFTRLSDREREILQLLAEEKSVKEIAAELGLSAKTVYAHQEHVMDKLGIRTVAGLTKYAVRQGLTGL